MIGLKTISQNLEKHQWNDRVVLIFSDDKSSSKLKKQVDLFQKEKVSLEERKLKIYQFAEGDFKYGFDDSWKKSTIKTKRFNDKEESFKIVLIGLDGGIKLKQNTILTPEKLFIIIDGMPMRKRELKIKN